MKTNKINPSSKIHLQEQMNLPESTKIPPEQWRRVYHTPPSLTTCGSTRRLRWTRKHGGLGSSFLPLCILILTMRVNVTCKIRKEIHKQFRFNLLFFADWPPSFYKNFAQIVSIGCLNSLVFGLMETRCLNNSLTRRGISV
jgi:hypothetical protein